MHLQDGNQSIHDSHYAELLDAVPAGILVITKEGAITYANTEAARLFGYARNELIDAPIDQLVPQRCAHNHAQYRQDYAQNPTPRNMGIGRELFGLRKDTSEFPLEIGLNPIVRDKDTMILAVITDITERKKLELNLKQANAHLEEFTYVASHDLKSPLRGIADLVEWIEEDLGETVPESVINNLSRINVRIHRMERLIDDLLIYARAGTRDKETMIFDVSILINNIIELHSIPANFTIKKDIRIQLIHAAKTPLETVLRNLLGNALKHHHGEHPQIELSAEACGNYCLFTVKDNGPGIPKAAQERVFRLFQTLGNNKNEGSGIGLALAKRLTESHGGNIELSHNTDTPGCCFKVWWPRFALHAIDS